MSGPKIETPHTSVSLVTTKLKYVLQNLNNYKNKINVTKALFNQNLYLKICYFFSFLNNIKYITLAQHSLCIVEPASPCHIAGLI